MSIERATEDSIRRTALAYPGAIAANVVVYESRQRDDAGEWYVLSIDRGEGFEVLGRRRSKSELLAMIETVNARAAI